MDVSSDRSDTPYLGLWTCMAVAFVVVLGLFAFLQGPRATESYGVSFSFAGWATVVLFVVSLTSVTVTRFLMLPAVARRRDAFPGSVITMGYLLALMPALYGLVGVVLSGEGWVSLPFSLLSLSAVVDLRVYFAAVYGADLSHDVSSDGMGDAQPPVDVDVGEQSALSYVRAVQDVDRLVNLVVTSLRSPRGGRHLST